MQKVIKVHDTSFEVVNNRSCASTCNKCFFGEYAHASDFGGCPRVDDIGGLLCIQLDEDMGEFGNSHYFVKVEETLVETFKEAAGIQTEKTYTRQQVWDAYFDCSRDSAAATRFCDHIEKMSDPEYHEYLRLQQKFGT